VADVTPPRVDAGSRRPLRTRSRPSATALAAALGRRGVRPNQISAASVLFAAAGAGCLGALPHVGEPARFVLLAAAAALVQFRLLANLMDGMVAVEGGRRTPTGELFNEIPDRLADLILLVAAGYAVTWVAWGDALGWAAGVAAVLTAYIRLLGGALGVTQHFCGPLAKPHRMAVLTAACLLSELEVAYGYAGRVLAVALAVVVVGSLLTFVRRTRLVVRELAAR
jgi:phosphatidylglycerophosphate synthase